MGGTSIDILGAQLCLVPSSSIDVPLLLLLADRGLLKDPGQKARLPPGRQSTVYTALKDASFLQHTHPAQEQFDPQAKKAGEVVDLRPYAGPDGKRTVEELVRVRSGAADHVRSIAITPA